MTVCRPVHRRSGEGDAPDSSGAPARENALAIPHSNCAGVRSTRRATYRLRNQRWARVTGAPSAALCSFGRDRVRNSHPATRAAQPLMEGASSWRAVSPAFDVTEVRRAIFRWLVACDRCPRLLPRCVRGRADAHLHERTRPAALKAAPTLAGLVVGFDAQHVVTGLRE